MGFATKKLDAESIKEETGGGKYINTSGIYDVTILAPIVEQGEKEAVSLNFFLSHEDQEQVIYSNLGITNKDGSDNFGAKVFNKLMIISDIDPEDPVEAELPIGKDGKLETVAILEDMTDIDCKMRVQMEYSTYNGSIREKKLIRSFYSAEGASAEEIVNGTEAGVQLAKDLPYAENITYKDGLDAEQVKAWIDAKRPKNTANDTKPSTTSKPSFGKKKFGSGK